MKKLLFLGCFLFLGACESAAPAAPEPLPVNPHETDAVPVETEAMIPEDWVEHKDEEIGVAFSGPDAVHSSKEELAHFDSGQLKNIQITDFGITGSSHDYELSEGEGCCYNFSGGALDLSKTDAELETEIATRLNEIYELERITVGGRDAVHFLRVNSYIESLLLPTVLIPYDKNGFSNLMISGPVLFMTASEESADSKEEQIQNFLENGLSSEEVRGKSELFETILSTVRFF